MMSRRHAAAPSTSTATTATASALDAGKWPMLNLEQPPQEFLSTTGSSPRPPPGLTAEEMLEEPYLGTKSTSTASSEPDPHTSSVVTAAPPSPFPGKEVRVSRSTHQVVTPVVAGGQSTTTATAKYHCPKCGALFSKWQLCHEHLRATQHAGSQKQCMVSKAAGGGKDAKKQSKVKPNFVVSTHQVVTPGVPCSTPSLSAPLQCWLKAQAGEKMDHDELHLALLEGGITADNRKEAVGSASIPLIEHAVNGNHKYLAVGALVSKENDITPRRQSRSDDEESEKGLLQKEEEELSPLDEPLSTSSPTSYAIISAMSRLSPQNLQAACEGQQFLTTVAAAVCPPTIPKPAQPVAPEPEEHCATRSLWPADTKKGISVASTSPSPEQVSPIDTALGTYTIAPPPFHGPSPLPTCHIATSSSACTGLPVPRRGDVQPSTRRPPQARGASPYGTGTPPPPQQHQRGSRDVHPPLPVPSSRSDWMCDPSQPIFCRWTELADAPFLEGVDAEV